MESFYDAIFSELLYILGPTLCNQHGMGSFFVLIEYEEFYKFVLDFIFYQKQWKKLYVAITSE